MVMPGRKYPAAGGVYRYGFNGKENDNEVKSLGNQIDYGFRIYDPRLSRFLSVDPLAKLYPELTTYQFASNSPIQGIDLDGREIENFMYGMKKKIFGVSSLKVNNLNTVIGEVQQQSYTVNIGNPTKNVNELKNQIATDINSIYGTDKGTFEFDKQQTNGQISKGDFINIDPGFKGVDMSVKVGNVASYDNDKPGVEAPHTGFSITLRTMEGHVEVGSITFTALEFTNTQTGSKSFEFNVFSTSQIDNGVATTILNPYARTAQQQVWQQVLKNVSEYMGGEIENAYQRIDKYKIQDITPVNNSETSIGYPNTEAVPASTETKDLEIK
jgi:RHS repeat-associated protein